jgi:hypothetical protein
VRIPCFVHGKNVALFLEQMDPPFAGVKMREFVKGTELFNLVRSSESIHPTNVIHGSNLLSHLFGVGASSARSMNMVGSKSAIGGTIGGVHCDDVERARGREGRREHYQIQNC